ncbi:helix-turn-helix domain-containing protein [Gottfriedia sp. NPDC057991]|uniref:helix-turn-helix domain-containing protein n=1 Tax=Gottfriedia sp. NPDC057991 TaxID=3346298 RepID=UPI0036DAB0BC
MKHISEKLLAEVVKKKRVEKNLSQVELGTITNINRQIIGRIEAGSHIPSLPQLDLLLDTLNIDFSEIMVEREQEDVFVAFLGEAKTKEEQEGFEKMVSMMLCFRKHLRLKGVHDE